MITSSKLINKNKPLSLLFLAGVPLVTLVVDPRINDPINVPKLIVIIMTATWLMTDLIKSYLKNPIKRKSIEQIFVIIVLLFLVGQIIVMFTGNSIFTQVFGDTQRKNGLVGYVSLAIIFLYALRHICSLNVQHFILIFVITGLIISAYGLIQVNGNDFIMWANPYNTTITTLGNPNFTSAFLSLTFILSFFLLLKNSTTKMLRVIALPLSLLSIFLIFKSDSRQGFYAIGAGILTYALIYAFLTDFKFKKLSTIVALFVSGISVLGMLQIGPLADLLYKQSVSTRGYYWRAALKMLLDHPITGVGLDSYGEYFRAYKEIGYVRTYGVEITSNNAHNTFLQLFSTGGLFVGLIYLIFIFLVLLFGIRSLRKISNIKNRDTALLLISIFVTYQAQSFVSIDNLGLSVWSWALAGAIIGLATEVESGKLAGIIKVKNNKKQKSIDSFTPILRLLTIAPVVILCILIYRPESHMLILRGLVEGNVSNNNSLAVEYAHKIIDNPLADPRLKLKATLYLGDLGYLEDTGRNLNLLVESNPIHFEYLWTTAFFQTQQGFATDAIKTRMKITEIDPFNHKNLLELMKIYNELGQKDKASQVKEMILSIDPKSDSAAAAEILLST